MSFPDGQVGLWVGGESGSTDPKRFRKCPMVFHPALGRPGQASLGGVQIFVDFISVHQHVLVMYRYANAGILTQ